MRKILPIGSGLAVAFALLTATPAAAAYEVTIAFPLDQHDFYSPFGGPATISFAFDPGDPPKVFHVKLRPLGGTAILKKDYVIDPSTAASNPVVRTPSWTDLNTTTDRTYEVVVTLDGGGAGPWSNFFVLHPKLARITNIAPDPFFPWLDDDYKDTTTVTFDLQNDAGVEARVYAAKASGACCVTPAVKTASLGDLPAGVNTWDWDGRDDGAANLPKGRYYVKIRADDGTFSPVLSKPRKVSIARTYRATATKSKLGKNYHHVGSSTSIVLGGGCLTYVSGDAVTVLCQGGKISVYWRWGLGPNERIVGQRFELSSSPGDCPRSIRSTGHTKHESWFTEKEDLSDFRGLCTIAEAKITYSYPVSS